MLRCFGDLRQCTAEALDADLGGVRDVLVDERTWAVRYLIIHVGPWLEEHREIPVALTAISRIDWEQHRIRLMLTREQIRECPPVRAYALAPEHEELLARHFGWPVYWGTAEQRRPAGRALRSLRALTGRDFRTTLAEGPAGRCSDCVGDDRNWRLRYVVACTSPPEALKPRCVLVPVSTIGGVDWSGRTIGLDVAAEHLHQAPEYVPAVAITPEYERRIEEHYRAAVEAA